MADLRQILAQGRKRIGLLLGAGTSASIKVDADQKISSEGAPLIPLVDQLTTSVLGDLDPLQAAVVNRLKADLDPDPNIEQILTRVRSFADLLGKNELHECDGPGFLAIAKKLCASIAKAVGPSLPLEVNAFSELAAWIGGTERAHPIEVFTTNYDFLLEEALERSEIPYFDGFSGSYKPFFDPPTIAKNDLPPRWGRLWKLHGSLGWESTPEGGVVRGGGRTAAELIYPDHLKYGHIQKLPFAALFDRLKQFLSNPDTLLLSCGFSYRDAHIASLIDESLSANPNASVFAFQFRSLQEECSACEIASKRPNMSVFATDSAQINCIKAPWRHGELPTQDWSAIRTSFWGKRSASTHPEFVLGDFSAFCRFLSLTHAEHMPPSLPEEPDQP